MSGGVTDDEIKELQRLDLCEACNCGLLAPDHHNELMPNHHLFKPIHKDVFTTALYDFEYPTARREAREECAKRLKAWKGSE